MADGKTSLACLGFYPLFWKSEIMRKLSCGVSLCLGMMVSAVFGKEA